MLRGPQTICGGPVPLFSKFDNYSWIFPCSWEWIYSIGNVSLNKSYNNYGQRKLCSSFLRINPASTKLVPFLTTKCFSSAIKLFVSNHRPFVFNCFPEVTPIYSVMYLRLVFYKCNRPCRILPFATYSRHARGTAQLNGWTGDWGVQGVEVPCFPHLILHCVFRRGWEEGVEPFNSLRFTFGSTRKMWQQCNASSSSPQRLRCPSAEQYVGHKLMKTSQTSTALATADCSGRGTTNRRVDRWMDEWLQYGDNVKVHT
jgi:hypothetical protein